VSPDVPGAHATRRLLVVDDDLLQRTIIGKIGSKLGFEAVVVSSFEEASRLLQGRRFDAMTLDLSLGEHDGIELLRLIAECRLDAMPIVIISGCEERILNSTRRVAEGLALTVADSLPKPLDLARLREALSPPRRDPIVKAAAVAVPDIDRERLVLGLARNEFVVAFQPKVELGSGKVVGAEALARWRTPEFGPIPPATFMPLAERFGMMPDLTYCILSSAIAQTRTLIAKHPDIAVAVGISGALLSDAMLPERIEAMLRAENVAAKHLMVEVTESVAMSDVDRAIDSLVRLRIKGVGAAIGDFGTGYSSLAALARFPFNELKIDRSLVRGCATDRDMLKVVEAAVALARAFEMKVVAEGIDDLTILARVRDAGCDIGQGLLFAPSLELEGVEAWMARRDEHAQSLPWTGRRTAASL
jgi:EAL domain-containing protein (putative c-di-GMP-specific phosphodiesterase class I)/FixJ family two-component response regulator